MKKKIVFVLCNIGLFRLAYKICASYAYLWQREVMRAALMKGNNEKRECKQYNRPPYKMDRKTKKIIKRLERWVKANERN